MKKRMSLVVMLLLLSWSPVKAEESDLIPEECQWESLGDPATVSLVVAGPYYEKTNIVVVVNIPHPETISKITFSNGITLDHPVLKEYELFLGGLMAGRYVIRATVNDVAGRVQKISAEFDVFPSNRYIRGVLQLPGNRAIARQDYLSSLIALDQERGDFLDLVQDFSLIYGNNYPWFLRATSELNAPLSCIIDPQLYPWESPTQSPYGMMNRVPVLHQQIVGGSPPMMAFGSSAKNGTPLFVNQDYHFGIIAGRPAPFGALKIEAYEKSDFENGAVNVAPAFVQTNNLPGTTDPEQLELLRNQFYIQDYHIQTNIHGKVLDFDTKIQYQFGEQGVTWGNSDFTTPILVTHRSANDLFYYKVSFKGDAPSLDFKQGVCMAFQVDEQGKHEAYNLTYGLDFNQADSWTTLFIHEPFFQNAVRSSSYLGKSLDELLHHTAPVQDSLSIPDAPKWQQLTELDHTPELKTHSSLDELAESLNNDPLAIANYVQNQIELTDAVGLSRTNDPVSLTTQGVMRDALGTYLEGQGSPIEQCELLIYLLRKAGVPAGYIFPEHDTTFLFDQQLSAMLHMQLRGAANMLGQPAGIPELIPVNYPWVAAYINGRWVHLFPWIKDTEVQEGKDLWNYFPDGYKDGRQWLCHYLLDDPAIRSLSSEDNVATLFRLDAEKQLQKNNLTLEDIGIRCHNRQHEYQDWEEFPRPWQTAAVANTNLVDHLRDDFFDTISIQVFSDRNGNREPDPGEPLLETGSLRFADLHDRRLLLYHQIIPGTTPPQYEMILSLEPYDMTSDPAAEKYSFAQGDHPDPGDLRAAQQLRTKLLTAANAGDLNDDNLCYKIVESHHKQAPSSDCQNIPQFLGLNEIDSLVDVRPLRKGDMALLSLNYGRVTEEMKNVELQKYLQYQRYLQDHPNVLVDPERATGQLLQLMGKTYYYHLTQFQEQLESWTKVRTISYRAHGLVKLSPEYGANGPLTTTNNNVVDFNLYYPRVDMSFQRAVILGNQTTHLESGANTSAADQSLQLLSGEGSAQEHHIINEFFNQADAISTVKLLDLTQQQGGKVLTLRQDNYQVEKANSLRVYSAKNDINGFVDLWNNIDSFFQNNQNDPFATVFLTQNPVTAEKQQGVPYTGMGAFSLSSTSASAWITDRMRVANGGFGGRLENPIVSSQPAIANTCFVAIPNGGFSFCQDPTKNGDDSSFISPGLVFPNYVATLPSSGSVAPFKNFQDQVAHGQQTLTPDVMGSISLWNYTVHQAVDNHASGIPILSNTGSQSAALLKEELNKGNIGLPCYYTASGQARAQGLWKLVHDPVNVATGEFYINNADLKLSGPIPLEVSRIYSSQNQTDSNLGYGWRLNYFPYLMLSDDENENTPSSLIYAAEPDGSVIAYRYQPENKIWAPTVSDNPSLINNNDGRSLKSKNDFNNRITKNKEGAYILKLADGSIRTFITKSFPLSADLPRTRPYLDQWKDVDGNTLQFSFGENKMANDFGQIKLITSSNGSSLHFRYDPYGRITEIFSSDGRRLKYGYDAYGDLISAMLPDGSTMNYQYQHANDDQKTYSKHLITQVTKPGGRIIKNDYDEKRRVINQYSTRGLSPNPQLSAHFQYQLDDNNNSVAGKTTVTDSNQHPTVYEISQNQITAIHFPENRNITQSWNAGLLMSRSDRRGLVTTFKYDQQGNLLSQTVNGNLTGNNEAAEQATTQFSYNNQNLLTAVTDQLGCSTRYAYDDQGHPASPTSITKIADGKTIETIQLSYLNKGKVNGLLASVNEGGAIINYDYDAQGFVSAITQKTGTVDPDLVTRCTSNQRGEVVAASMPDGSQQKYSYDALGHPTGVEVYDAKGNLIDWHFRYYNQNEEMTWKQGARFNPVDQTYYDYDRAGNLLHQLAFLRAGLSTTSYQYDEQGNATSITDPNGNITTMTYDGLGEMLSRLLSDGSEEKFSYELGGKIATHQTFLGGHEFYQYTSTGLLQSASYADGSSVQYRYDLSGRLCEEILSQGLHCQWTYEGNTMTKHFHDAAGKSLGSISETYDGRGNLLKKIDLAGNTWSYNYDGLNRLKSEQGPPAAGNTPVQTITHLYRPGFESSINALGEQTNHFFDALGRPILTTVLNKDGSVAQNISRQYSGDHQSMKTIVGTGDNAITTTTWTDEDNHLTMLQHADGSFKNFDYDGNGNLVSFLDEAGHLTTYTYDGLNHLISEKRPDGTVINYSWNAAGELLARLMPQGLVEKNQYNEAGEKISSALLGSDGAATRNYEYYYDHGLLTSIIDPRGGKISIDADVWMRPARVSSSGFSVPEQNQTTTYSYDVQGLLTSIEQSYNDPATGPSTLVSRSYDAYKQLISETTALNGCNIAAWSQTWDEAGRRRALAWSLDEKGKGAHYAFDYNALGLMTRAQNGSGTASYVYGDHGLLLSETTPAGQKKIQRDQQGRLLHQTLPEKSEETLSWKSDGKISSYSIVGTANETRNYDYDALGRLIQEPYTLTESAAPDLLPTGTHIATYSFDDLGVRLKQQVTSEIENAVTQKNNFSQVVVDDLTSGVNKAYPWRSSYDATGEVTARGIEGVLGQELTWDSMGRLVTVVQRNQNDQGYNWKTVYDGLGRRIQTSYCDATGGQPTSKPLTIDYYYDPEVEFLELGHDYFGRLWNLYGPDCSGFYGGAQGIGGLVQTASEGHTEVHGVVNDFFGNSIGITTGDVFQPWGNVLGGYGAMPGSSVNADLVPQWRDHYLDWTGFYYMGRRYYEPKSGRFLSPDPLGHDASLSLYDYCDGDPVNGLDPDGRCVEKCYLNLDETGRQNFDYMLNTAFHAPSVEDGLHALAGIPLGFADLNIWQPFGPTPQGAVNFSGNGINMDNQSRQGMVYDIAKYAGIPLRNITSIENPTHGLFFDLIRCIGQSLGATDIASLKAADAFNAAGPGEINAVMFSNGTALFGGAMPFVGADVKARLNFQGFGGQWNINQKFYGLKRASNTRHLLDLVPMLTPANWFQSSHVIRSESSFDSKAPLKFHNFKNIYAPQIVPIQ